MENIYLRLRERLNQYSNGFPETASGIEKRILKKLFTPEEAALFLEMSMMAETPESVAARIGRDATATGAALEAMAKKGLLFRLRKAEFVKYAAVPFIVGFYEYQVARMDRELAEMVEAYFREAMFGALAGSIEPVRTIPVERSLDAAVQVSSYADARKIIAGKHKIAVTDCVCRTQKGLLGKSCGKPVEVCLVFGSHAAFYMENNMAREITREEALQILDLCEKEGLVNQPANMVNPGGMCNCCGDCCAVLQSLRMLANPAEMVFNDYFAAVDAEKCTGCEACLDRCQMDAIRIEAGGAAVIDTRRCIGCGLCVTTCPAEAVSLTIKPEDQRRMPPANGMDLMIKISEIRDIPLSSLAGPRPR